MSLSENLHNLGALMKTNLETKGIDGLTGNEGLTTLANKILDISSGSCDSLTLIGLPQIIQKDETSHIGAKLIVSGSPVVNETIYFNIKPPEKYCADYNSFSQLFTENSLGGRGYKSKDKIIQFTASGDTEISFISETMGNPYLTQALGKGKYIITFYDSPFQLFEVINGEAAYINSISTPSGDVWFDFEKNSSNDNVTNIRIRERTIITSAKTDKNGIATIPYVGTGKGMMTVEANYYYKDGGILQETFVIEDCLKTYMGTFLDHYDDTVTKTLDYTLPSNWKIECELLFTQSSDNSCFFRIGETDSKALLVGRVGSNASNYQVYARNGNDIITTGSAVSFSNNWQPITMTFDGTTFNFNNDISVTNFNGVSLTKLLNVLSWKRNNYSGQVRNIKIKALPEKEPDNLTLSSATPIIQKDDTAVVNALLTHNGSAYSSQSLSYTVKHGSSVIDSGTLTTDSDGKASISYTGTGVGDVTFTVEYGTLLQKTYELEDCMKYYPLVDNSDESAFTIPTGTTVSYSDEGMRLSANAYKQIKLTEKLTSDCSVEFTVVDYSTPSYSYPPIIVYAYTNGETTPNQQIFISNDSSSMLILGNTINHVPVKGGKYKIEYTSSNIRVYENNTLLASASNTVGLPTRFEWHMGANNRYAVYKDLKVKALPEKEPDNLTLSSATPIIQKDDTATINATLTHNDVAVSGKTLNYVVKHGDNILDSGSVVTGSDGTASISYTGTGVGDVSVEVSYGTLLQKTYIVYDVLWKQKCTANDTDAFSNQYGTITDNGETLTLSCSSSNNSFIWLDKAGSSSSAGDGDYTGDYVFECEVTSVTNYSRMMVYAPINGTGSQSFQLSVGKCKMVKQGNTYSYFINDVEQQISPVTKSIDSPYRIGFGVNNGASVTLKNIKLKALPEKEPDNLTLSSATPIIQKDDTATINATLTHNDVAVSGKTLNYVVKHGDSILDSGSVVTDTNGEASITYTGTGIGDVSVEVSYDNLLQKTYELIDAIYYDTATSDQSSNYYYTPIGGVSFSYQNNWYVLTLGTSANYVQLNGLTDNVKGKTINFEVELELNGASTRLEVYADSTRIGYSPYSTSNGVLSISDLAIPSDATNVYFRIVRRYTDDGDSIKFKNFKLYQKETYEVMDTQFYDGGVTGNTNNHWYNYGNRLSVAVDNTGTLLTSLNSQYGYYYPIQPSDEITDANSYWFDTFIMEFDIVSTSSTSNEIVMYNPVDPTTYISISYMGLTTSGGHIKIVYDGSTVKVFANDVLTVNFTKVFNQKFRVGFDVHPNESLKYKNCMIYPTI